MKISLVASIIILLLIIFSSVYTSQSVIGAINSTTASPPNSTIGTAPVNSTKYSIEATKLSFMYGSANITQLIPSITVSVSGISCIIIQVSVFSHNSTTYTWNLSGTSVCNLDSLTTSTIIYLNNATNHQKEIIVTGTTIQTGLNPIINTITFQLSVLGKSTLIGTTLFVGNIGYDWTALSSFNPTFNNNILTVSTTVSSALTTTYKFDPVTVGTSNSNGNCGGTGCDNQLKLWQITVANGSLYYHYFYTDNSHFGYRFCNQSDFGNCNTASTHWSSFNTLSSNAAIGECSTNINKTISPTYVYYACATSGTTFNFQSGHVGNNGIITCSIGASCITGQRTINILQSQSEYAFIQPITNTDIWVSVKSYDGTNEHVEVWRCGTSSCFTPANWVNKLDQNDNFGNNDAHPTLSHIKVGSTFYTAVFWGYDGYSINFALHIKYTINSGTSWSASIVSACNIDAMGYSLVNNSNGTAYIVAIQASAGATGCTQGKMDYIRWDYGSATITYETKNFNVAGGGFDGISISTDGGSVYSIVTETSSTTIKYMLSSNNGNTYGALVTISSSENFNSLDFTVTNSYFCDNSNELVGWISGAGTPFNVQFATFQCSTSIAYSFTLSPSITYSGTVTSILLGITISPTITESGTNSMGIGNNQTATISYTGLIKTIGLGIILSPTINYFGNQILCFPSCGGGGTTTIIEDSIDISILLGFLLFFLLVRRQQEQKKNGNNKTNK